MSTGAASTGASVQLIVADWALDPEPLREKYFRPGPYSWLRVHDVREHPGGAVSFRYTMRWRDLGYDNMCARGVRVTPAAGGLCSVNGGAPVPAEPGALADACFEGVWDPIMRETLEELMQY